MAGPLGIGSGGGGGGGSGTVTSVSGNAPITVANGTTTPAISVTAAAPGAVTGGATASAGTIANGVAAADHVHSTSNLAILNATNTLTNQTKSDRMQGKYFQPSPDPLLWGNKPFDMTYNSILNSTDSLAINRLATMIAASSAGIPEANFDPAYGSSYGTKKVGLGFHVGTYTQILTQVAGNPPTAGISDNVNGVFVGYMGTGPRFILSDYDLVNETPNTIRYIASEHNFVVGFIGIGTGVTPAQHLTINAASGVNRLVQFSQADTAKAYVGIGTDNVMRVMTTDGAQVRVGVNNGDVAYASTTGFGIFTQPSAALHVNGNGIISGTLTVGGNAVLTTASSVSASKALSFMTMGV